MRRVRRDDQVLPVRGPAALPLCAWSPMSTYHLSWHTSPSPGSGTEAARSALLARLIKECEILGCVLLAAALTGRGVDLIVSVAACLSADDCVRRLAARTGDRSLAAPSPANGDERMGQLCRDRYRTARIRWRNPILMSHKLADLGPDPEGEVLLFQPRVAVTSPESPA